MYILLDKTTSDTWFAETVYKEIHFLHTQFPWTVDHLIFWLNLCLRGSVGVATADFSLCGWFLTLVGGLGCKFSPQYYGVCQNWPPPFVLFDLYWFKLFPNQGQHQTGWLCCFYLFSFKNCQWSLKNAVYWQSKCAAVSTAGSCTLTCWKCFLCKIRRNSQYKIY